MILRYLLFYILISLLCLQKAGSLITSFLINQYKSINHRHHITCHKATINTINQIEKDNDFDFKLSLLLAGFSFESYNDKVMGKKAVGLDHTIITFTSSNLINKVFKGVLLLKIKSGQFKYEETQLTERLISGNEADPFIICHIEHDEFSKIRIIDSFTTTTKFNTNNAIWNENGYLYIRNPDEAYLAIAALDRYIPYTVYVYAYYICVCTCVLSMQ